MPEADLNGFREFLLEQVQEQNWPVGHRLPSVRELASQLGYNKNTVHKLYQKLAREGLVHVLPARGAFLAAPAGQPNGLEQARVREAFRRAAADARSLQLPVELTRAIGRDAILEAYRDLPTKIAFIECNQHDARATGSELEGYLGAQVAKELLGAVARQPSYFADRFDFLITTFFHLAELEQLLPGHTERIIGVNLIPDHTSVEEIARIPSECRLAVVSLTAITLERMVNITRVYTRAELVPCVANEPRLFDVLHAVDRVIDTLGSHERVLSCGPPGQVLTLQFRIDPRSIRYVRRHMTAAAG